MKTQHAQPSSPPAPAGTLVAGRSLAEVLDRHTVTGSLWQPEDGKVRCAACGHRCLIGEGRRGICKVRFNHGGELKVPFGYVAGLASDPVEKKPFFHVFPGSDALTFGMLGCDFHCGYCQNWVTSQALRNEAARAPIQPTTAAQIVGAAERSGAKLVVSSYNEPLITAEWAVAVFKEAVERGFTCGFVSNGNATTEVLDFLEPWIRCYKVDLKTFDDRRYRSLGGTLAHVQETVRQIHARGIWLEVLTLLVPGWNDGENELRAIARFIASICPAIPWHVTAFHKDYQMTEPANATATDLVRAAEIGASEGLQFVYAGNLPGRVGEWENTRCPGCHATLIERRGYVIHDCQIAANGQCPRCGRKIPGIWSTEPAHDAATDAGRLGSLPRPMEL